MTSSRASYDSFEVPVRGLRMLVFFAIALLALPRVTGAATILVGDGKETSCTASALQNALFASAAAGGDVIQFNCGPNPVTITVTATTELADGSIVALLPPNQTTIDGGNRITLARSDWAGNLMVVASDTTVTIQNLTLQGAALLYGTTPDPNVVNRGTLFIRNVRLSLVSDGNLVAPASIDNRGTLIMRDSTVAGIKGTTTSSAPIRNFGTATIDHSTFADNSHYPYAFRGLDDGGAIVNTGALAVNNSVFTDNQVGINALGGGGAIANLGGTVTINGSQFSRNRAYYGGAIENRLGGAITVTNSSFDHNYGFEAGALLGSYVESIPATIVVKHCDFQYNGGTYGGAIEHQNGTISVENSTISHNGAIWGGGIVTNTALTMVNSHVNFNSASVGGGILLWGPFSSLTLWRTDVTNNTQDDIGEVYRDTTTNTSTVVLHGKR